MDIKLEKKKIRDKILEERKKLNSQNIEEISDIIINKVKDLDSYHKSKNIFIYVDFKNEVETKKFIKYMLSDNKKVIIPYTDTKNTNIIPVEIKNLEEDVKVSSYGYLEPNNNETSIDIDKIDLIIVPGVAFDKRLNRIGFGKGYYDRILQNKAKNSNVVAIAFEFQVMESIPYDKHDIKMDMIITEKNIYYK